MLPERERAEALLQEAAGRNPGPWVEHSRQVALAAQCIAQAHPRLEPERAYVLGLLHDIGRRFGPNRDTHILHGHDYLLALGYPGSARTALTHSPSLFEEPCRIISPWDGTPAEWERLRALVEGIMAGGGLTEEDRLFQLCDCLALPDGLCTLPERLLDVALRHGVSPQEPQRWRVYLAIKAEFDAACGQNVYRLLPGLCERLLA